MTINYCNITNRIILLLYKKLHEKTANINSPTIRCFR